jgi:glutamate formiminotransferase/formiminotetrahydrofolate cyclodeaminase
MVAVLSHTRKGFESKQPDLDRIAVRAQTLKDRFLSAVDADTAAFDQLLDAMRMPKSTPEEQSARDAAITEATIAATEVPLGVLESCPRSSNSTSKSPASASKPPSPTPASARRWAGRRRRVRTRTSASIWRG